MTIYRILRRLAPAVAALFAAADVAAVDPAALYQQNEYLGWIGKAKLEADKQKRLAQFVDELAKGNVYMGEPWAPPAPVA